MVPVVSIGITAFVRSEGCEERGRRTAICHCSITITQQGKRSTIQLGLSSGERAKAGAKEQAKMSAAAQSGCRPECWPPGWPVYECDCRRPRSWPIHHGPSASLEPHARWLAPSSARQGVEMEFTGREPVCWCLYAGLRLEATLDCCRSMAYEGHGGPGRRSIQTAAGKSQHLRCQRHHVETFGLPTQWSALVVRLYASGSPSSQEALK